MTRPNYLRSSALSLVLALPGVFAANHREAPINALDHQADITDVFAFRSYDGGTTPRVTLIHVRGSLAGTVEWAEVVALGSRYPVRRQDQQQQRCRGICRV